MQQQGQLLADPGLADEVVEALGAQRALDDPLIAVGKRRDNAVFSLGDDPPYPPVSAPPGLIAKTATVSGLPARTVSSRKDADHVR